MLSASLIPFPLSKMDMVVMLKSYGCPFGISGAELNPPLSECFEGCNSQLELPRGEVGPVKRIVKALGARLIKI